ncbi:hypothetical protein RvY_04029 [Ramazzottius varieornatus]|uniref:Uncharacterized protein n=1 Tax=Ramazzottius varieornatus TaxID=947166 RepID=A0A1D1UTL2_RAMVA|nr:hypothetical protein RvY_04029 [Ramazzottius varieornatus]
MDKLQGGLVGRHWYYRPPWSGGYWDVTVHKIQSRNKKCVDNRKRSIIRNVKGP